MSDDHTAAIRAEPDSDAVWEAWFRAIYPRVLYLMTRRSSGQIELAEEMTQAAIERFLRYRSYEKVASNNEAVAYLVQTATRLLVDETRRSERAPTFAPDHLEQHADAEATDGAQTLESEGVTALLGQLSKTDQQVLNMVLDGLTTKEIAKSLGLGYSTAGMRIQRAKARLKKVALGCE